MLFITACTSATATYSGAYFPSISVTVFLRLGEKKREKVVTQLSPGSVGLKESELILLSPVFSISLPITFFVRELSTVHIIDICK